ncbi:MAG: LytTR family transcriptional regulator, partial [Lachnospiraceae bacterium]|nr:LytTR family transcriptional regulator [Lachnospiraceae bacterium]
DFLLIFITEHTEYVFEALEYMPFRFIRKERMEKELPAAIQAACEKVAKDGNFPVLINTSDQTEMLRAGDILYYALENRKCMIYTMRGEYEVWKTIRDMRKELGSYDESFLQIYRGCMVNKKYIRTIKNETVILENGTELPFSRRKRKEISDRMMRYWGKMV